MTNLTEIKFLGISPFGSYKASFGGIPTSYTEALTYEEQLIWFCKYIEETVIPTVNTNATALKELQEEFEEILPTIEEMKTAVEEMKSTVETLNTRVTTNESDITELKTDVEEMKSTVETLNTRVTTNESDITELKTDVSRKATLVMLYSDGNAIYSDKEMTLQMTYLTVKTILDDPTKETLLHNGNYNLRPEYTYTDSSGVTAIWFNGVTTLDGKPYIYRIIINSLDQVRNDEYELALETEITAINNILNGITEAVDKQSEVTA